MRKRSHLSPESCKVILQEEKLSTIFFHPNLHCITECYEDHKMVKHAQTIWRQQPANYLSVFYHFVGLAFKGLKTIIDFI